MSSVVLLWPEVQQKEWDHKDWIWGQEGFIFATARINILAILAVWPEGLHCWSVAWWLHLFDLTWKISQQLLFQYENTDIFVFSLTIEPKWGWYFLVFSEGRNPNDLDNPKTFSPAAMSHCSVLWFITEHLWNYCNSHQTLSFVLIRNVYNAKVVSVIKKIIKSIDSI